MVDSTRDTHLDGIQPADLDIRDSDDVVDT